MPDDAAEHDPVLAALDRLITAIDDAQNDMAKVRRRAEVLKSLRSEGRTYAEAVNEEDRPLIVEVMRRVIGELGDAASRFQRAEARALWDEGVTMDRIAGVFGISRQRVSGLLGAPGRRRPPTSPV